MDLKVVLSSFSMIFFILYY